jgi:hypothetical protein
VSIPKKPINPNEKNSPSKPGRTRDSVSNGRNPALEDWKPKKDQAVRGSAPMDRDARPPIKKK